MYYYESLVGLMEDYENAIGQIDLESAALLEKRKALLITQEHLASCVSISSDVKEIRVEDGRYDYYLLDEEHAPDIQCWMQHMEQFVVCLRIEPEMLRAKETPACIPLKTGIGTYQGLLRKYGLRVPDGAVYCPPGRFLTSIIELDQLDCIPADDIQPLKEYAKRKGLRITGESTAFLIRVNHTKERESFVFRLRIRVEESR